MHKPQNYAEVNDDDERESDPYADAADEEMEMYMPENERSEHDDEHDDSAPLEAGGKKPKVQKGHKSKHAPVPLNPTNYTHEMVFKGNIDRSLRVGPPPVEKKMKSEQWKLGMQFVYFTQSQEECTNWYYCSICAWTHNQKLSSGTRNILSHVRGHINDTYTLTRDQLASIIWKATQIKKLSGSLTLAKIKKLIPISVEWSEQFLDDMICAAVPNNMKPKVHIKNSAEIELEFQRLRTISNKTGPPPILTRDDLRKRALQVTRNCSAFIPSSRQHMSKPRSALRTKKLSSKSDESTGKNEQVDDVNDNSTSKLRDFLKKPMPKSAEERLEKQISEAAMSKTRDKAVTGKFE